MRVVYCTCSGDKGAVFLALMATTERIMVGGTEHRVVLIPTAPVPVGGSLLLLPSDSIQRANISVEGFRSIYLSMGATTSQFLPKPV